MENASKALIIAGEVLIGVIVLSVGVALFTMFQNYSKQTVEQLNESQIAEFNNNFLKYYGVIGDDETGKQKPIEVTAHDIISLAKFAKENNKKYDLDFDKNASLSDIESTFYVKIDVENEKGLEKWDDEDFNKFLKNNSTNLIKDSKVGEGTISSIYFQANEPKISSKTNRVYYISFKKIN